MYLPRALSRLGDQIEALLREPASETHAAAVRAAARESGDWGAFARAFRDRGNKLAEVGRGELAIASFIEAAQVFEEELEDLEAAAAQWEQVLALQGSHRRAMFSLGLLLHDLARWEALVALYRRRLQITDDPGERTTLHLYIAEILSERLQDDRGAFAELQTATRLAPKNLRIISRLEYLGERTQQAEEVAVVLGDLILNADEPRIRAALSLKLAELHLGPLQDSKRALAYLRAALADDGGNPEILSEIEDVFRERDRFDELAELLEEVTHDRRSGPHRVRLERELARIYELELDDLGRAIQALTRALKHAPEDRELLDEVMRLAVMGGQLELVAETYTQVLAQTENALLRTYLRLKLGHIYGSVLGRSADAMEVYASILEEDPGHKEARRRLARLAEKSSDHLTLARLLELDAAELGPVPDAVPLYERLMRLRFEALDDPAAGVETCRAILAIQPDHAEAAQMILHHESAEPVESVDDAGNFTSPHEAPTEFEDSPYGPESETHYHRALATEGPRRPPPGANLDPVVEEDEHESAPLVHPVDGYVRSPTSPMEEEDPVELMQALRIQDDEDEDDDPPPTRLPTGILRAVPPPPPSVDDEEEDAREDATIAAEALVLNAESDAVSAEAIALDTASEIEAASEIESSSEIEPEVSAADVALERRVAEILEELGEAAQREENSRAVELLGELVEAQENLGRTADALDAAVRLAQLHPTNERLEELLRLGRTQSAATVIEVISALAPRLGQDAELRFGLALVDLEVANHAVPSALRRLEALYELSGGDEAVFGRWASVLDDVGRHADLAELLWRRVENAADDRQAWAFAQRALVVWDQKLGLPERARWALQTLLERSPTLFEAASELERRLEDAGDFAALAALWTDRLYRLEGEDRARLRLRLAALQLEHLHDAGSAEATLRAGLEERAKDASLLEALANLYQAEARWEDFFELGRRRLLVLRSARARATLARELAQIAEQRFLDPVLALGLLAEARDADPEDKETLLAEERIHRARGDWEGAAESLVARLPLSEGASESVAIYRALAELRADHLQDPQGAREALGQALDLAPKDPDLWLALAQIEESGGDRDAARVTLERLGELTQGAERAAAWVRLGRLLEQQGDDDGARAQHQAALEADPGCADALLALYALAERQEDWLQATELSGALAENAEDERDRAFFWQRAARLAADRLGDDLRALEFFERALQADPDDLATEATLGERLLERQEFARALPHLERAAQGLSDPARKLALALAAGRAAEKLQKTESAIAAYEAVLNLRATHLEALDRLSALLLARQSWERGYELSAHLILHHESSLAPVQRAEVYLRMAQAKRATDDLESAARLAKRSLQLADGRVESFRLLAEIFEAQSDGFEAAEYYKRMVPLLASATEKKEALARAARLVLDATDDVARATALLTEAQSHAPRDLPVAERLSELRERLGDPIGAADALIVAARLHEGRPRADLLVRAARIVSASGKDRSRTKRLLEEALDLVPTHPDARADLSVMLAFDGELGALAVLEERAANEFLANPATDSDAAGGRHAAAIQIFDRLLHLYRFRLEAPERALAVVKRLLELVPDQPRFLDAHARLLSLVAQRAVAQPEPLLQEALALWAERVETTPSDFEALDQVATLSRVLGDQVQLRLISELSTFLGQPRPALGFQVVDLPRPATFSVHPSEAKTPLHDVFTSLGTAALRALADELPEPRPKRRDLVGGAGLGIRLSRPLSFAARVLGVDVPPVYVRDDIPFAVGPTWVADQPALLVSLQQAEALSDDALRFWMGRSLSLLRPRALTLVAVPLELLRDALVGFSKVSDPESYFVDARQAKKRGRLLEKAVGPADRAALQSLTTRWLHQRTSLDDEKRAVERSADRAGLVSAASLSVAIEALGGVGVDRRVSLPLMTFAASRAFTELVRGLC